MLTSFLIVGKGRNVRVNAYAIQKMQGNDVCPRYFGTIQLPDERDKSLSRRKNEIILVESDFEILIGIQKRGAKA